MKNKFLFPFTTILVLLSNASIGQNYTNITEYTSAFGIGNSQTRIVNPSTVQQKNSSTYAQENSALCFGFRTINGYQFNEHISLGLGIGMDFYKKPFTIDQIFLPITVDTRIALRKGRISPAIGVNTGYTLGLPNSYNDLQSGFMLNPQFGVKIFLGMRAAALLNIGYKLHMVYFSDNYQSAYAYGPITKYATNNHFLTVSAGISF